MDTFPFKPGDWVADTSERVAKVRSVYEGVPGEVLLDLVIYSDNGEKVGRASPACGGPRTFEPACSAEFWRRIAEPRWPIRPMWVPNENGTSTMRKFAGETLPPANWKRPSRKRPSFPSPPPDEFRVALEAIAKGHNDARQLTLDTLRKADVLKLNG